MTHTQTLRRVRILLVGGAKARTNDATGNKSLEEDQSRYNF